jgi:regulator of RNase E activity RraA
VTDADKLDRLAAFGSTLCLDALRGTGVVRVYMEDVNRLVAPATGAFAGVAVTLRMLPERPDLNNEIAPLRERSAEYVAMEKCDALSVLVIDAMGWRHDSVGGEIKFSRLAHKRARALVTDGGVRDLDTLREYGLAVFAATQTAMAGPMSFQPAQEGLPIQCGGVLVRPGDVLVGDAAGVVVVPRPMVDQVLEFCAERAELEAYIKDQLKKHPQSPGRFYPINDDIKREFAAWKKQRKP